MWCVDAATHGIAALRKEWPLRSVIETGRSEERWLFKACNDMPAGARELGIIGQPPIL